MRCIRRNHLTLALATIALTASAADAQKKARANARPDELRGSKASVEKMYNFANAHRLTFYLTQTNIDSAIARGRLVPLTGDSTYELTRGVGFSYSTREAKQFVQAFAPQYLHACGAPLTVTSAARPTTRQPRNANPHSVHPTGIAVDLRRPYRGPCLDWVRKSLAELERKGIIEVTEERHPVHLHLAVLVPPGRKVTLPNLIAGVPAAPRNYAVQAPVLPPVTTGMSTRVVSSAAGDVALPKLTAPSNAAKTYVVRPGDTLWDIANKVGVSVAQLKKANASLKRALKPGTTLVVPERNGL
jgi:LysM repeat protein